MGTPGGDGESEKILPAWRGSAQTAPVRDQSAWLTIAEICENCQRRAMIAWLWVNAKHRSQTVDWFMGKARAINNTRGAFRSHDPLRFTADTGRV